MKCYNHPESEAVATCKHCYKGMCAACAKNSGWGFVCSPQCEEEVKMVRAMVERNRKMIPFAARNSARSAIILFAMAAVFIGFGLVVTGPFRIYMIAFGLIMLVGGGFSVLNSRRLARL
jgi:hypothetical protein